MKSPSHLRGFYCELKVIDELLKQDWVLLNHRYQTPFGECDVFMKKGNSYLMVEVKSVSDFQMEILQTRIKSKQKQRLLKIYYFLSEKYNAKILMGVAYVKPTDKILWQQIYS